MVKQVGGIGEAESVFGILEKFQLYIFWIGQMHGWEKYETQVGIRMLWRSQSTEG